MKIKDLIAELSNFDEESEVYFAYDARDYWNTTVAEQIKGVKELDLKWSDYHNLNAINFSEESDSDSTHCVIIGEKSWPVV